MSGTMKNLILILLTLCGLSCTEAVAQDNVEVGQVWKWDFNGCKVRVVQDGEYIVHQFVEGALILDVDTKEDFLDRYTLVCVPVEAESEVVEFAPEEWTVVYEDDSIEVLVSVDEADSVHFTTEGVEAEAFYLDASAWELLPEKPYIYKNPNNDHITCTVHGDLEPTAPAGEIAFDSIVYLVDITYCLDCYCDTQLKLVNQYITGIQEDVE